MQKETRNDGAVIAKRNKNKEAYKQGIMSGRSAAQRLAGSDI